jgi:hypothetical protein
MEWPFIVLMLPMVIGIAVLVVKRDKASIRRAVEENRGELLRIDTAFDLLMGHFKYKVTFESRGGRTAQEECRVSFLLGVIWDDEDSFIKHLVP